MTIDEAIKQFKYDAECNRADLDLSYAEDNEQIAEWLEELKAIKSDVFTDYLLNMGFTKGYNKAIDDFTEKAIKIVYESNNRDKNPQPRDMVADIHYKFIELAKQLKAGEPE